MTFRHATDEEIKKALYQSIYYWHNKSAIQAQQKEYRTINKERIRKTWVSSSKRYRDKNKHLYSMYATLLNLAKNDGML